MLKKCRIEIEGHEPVFSLPGPLFLDVLNGAGIDLHNDCGGMGKCSKCRILFRGPAPECRDGDLKHLSEAERAEGMRLACFHQVRQDCQIEPRPLIFSDELLDDL